MRYRNFALCLLFASLGCSSANFSDIGDGRLELEFDSLKGLRGSSGRWEIVEDESAPSGNDVLAQTGMADSAEFNVVLVPIFETVDLDLSVEFRSIAGEIDQGGGPVWRALDGNNYYVARYNPLENNYRVYTVKDGERTELLSADIAGTPGWHTLRVTMVGDLIRCYYDGALQLEVRDTTFTREGLVGLWTKADAQTHFDDLIVR